MTDQERPLFSLLNGEGSGVLLGLAAGDIAGDMAAGISGSTYSATTQQATVVAYHLMENGGIDSRKLSADLVELAGDGQAPTVYRRTSPEFNDWLESSRRGDPAAVAGASAEPAARAAALGVWYRRQPEELVKASVDLARLTHIDATTAVGAAVTTGAVAAGCFAQSGRDMVAAALEVAVMAEMAVAHEPYRFSHSEETAQLVDRLRRCIELVDLPIDEAISSLGLSPRPTATELPIVAMLIAAPLADEPFTQIETAASLGGSLLGAMVGAVVGARAGLREWPLSVPNDSWFAEVGRRLVQGHRETRDLPVPYSVEERLTLS
jgi:ADP-ribosylglycohydrolase